PRRGDRRRRPARRRTALLAASDLGDRTPQPLPAAALDRAHRPTARPGLGPDELPAGAPRPVSTAVATACAVVGGPGSPAQDSNATPTTPGTVEASTRAISRMWSSVGPSRRTTPSTTST